MLPLIPTPPPTTNAPLVVPVDPVSPVGPVVPVVPVVPAEREAEAPGTGGHKDRDLPFGHGIADERIGDDDHDQEARGDAPPPARGTVQFSTRAYQPEDPGRRSEFD